MARHNSVSIGGIEYYIRGPVIGQPVSDFAANIRIGEPSYETRQGAGYIVFDDLSGGPGVRHGLAREDLARYSDTDGVDTRFSRQATLPLKAEVADVTPTAPDSAQTMAARTHLRRTERAMQHYNHDPLGTGASVYDVFAYAQRLYYQKPSDYGLSWTSMDVGIDCILDMAVYTPPTGASTKGTRYVFVVGKAGWRRIRLES